MIDLLRRDPTLRALPRWLIVVPMVVSFFELIRIYRLTTVVDSEPAWGDLLSAMGLWSVLALWMLLGKTAQQCTEFDLALPLSTRRLWRAHLVAVVLAGLLMLATAIGAVALPSWLLTTFLTDRMIPSTGITAMMLPAAACLCAALAALQTPGRALYRTPLSWRQAVRVGAVITVAGAVTLWFATLSAWLAVLPALLATGLVWRIYTALPEAFVLLPRDAVTPVRRPSGAAAEGAGGNVNPPALLPAGGAGRWRTYLVFFRVLAGGVAPGQLLQVPVTMVGLPFLVPWGTALAGFWTVDTVLSFTLVPMTAYILFALMAAPLTQLRVLDPLPVSRRFIFAAAVLPGLALVSLGYSKPEARRAVKTALLGDGDATLESLIKEALALLAG